MVSVRVGLGSVAVAMAIASGVTRIRRAEAINASPELFTETNCDGSNTGFLRMWGTPEYHGVETSVGYTILRDPDSDCLVYAMLDITSGVLTASKMLVGVDEPPSDLPKHLRESSSVREKKCKDNDYCRFKMNSRRRLSSGTVVTEGTMKNIVILMKFSGHENRRLPTVEDIDELFNSEQASQMAPTGSVRMIFHEFSYNSLTIDSTITEWETISKTEKECSGDDDESGLTTGFHECMAEVLGKAHTSHDLSKFDSITILHSGYAAEYGGEDTYDTHYTNRIWSHHWEMDPSLYPADLGLSAYRYQVTSAIWTKGGHSIARVGAIAHEIGHYLGLPALYDSSGIGYGIGAYGLMSHPWGFDGSQWFPPHPCAWSKIHLGWIDPDTDVETLTTDGEYDIPPIQLEPKVYRIETGFPTDEYLLLENRRMYGADAKLPQAGLLVWHIDEKEDQTLESGQDHYRVALIQADGEQALEGGKDHGDSDDVFHSSWHNGITPEGVYSTEEKGYDTDPELVANVPNTNSYQGGTEKPTGVSITHIGMKSKTSQSMTFQFSTSTVSQHTEEKGNQKPGCDEHFCAIGDNNCCEGYSCHDHKCKKDD